MTSPVKLRVYSLLAILAVSDEEQGRLLRGCCYCRPARLILHC